MSKSIRSLFFLIALLPATALAQQFSATLSGANEVPPGAGDPEGTGTASITFVGTTVNYTITVANVTLPPTMQHIHSGMAGVNGPIVIDLPGTWIGNQLTGSTTTSAATANSVISNATAFYVNVHTSDFQAGAVRGQLTGVASTSNIPAFDQRGMLALGIVLLATGGVWFARRG